MNDLTRVFDFEKTDYIIQRMKSERFQLAFYPNKEMYAPVEIIEEIWDVREWELSRSYKILFTGYAGPFELNVNKVASTWSNAIEQGIKILQQYKKLRDDGKETTRKIGSTT